MKRYKDKFIFYITGDLKKSMEKRANDLEISMADYLRTLIKQDIKLDTIAYLNYIKDEYVYDIDNISKKLSGSYKEIR